MNEVLIEYIHGQLLNGRADVAVGPDDDLLASGLVDSIGMLQIIQFVEKRFSISIPFEDVTIENFGTVGNMSSYLDNRGVAP